MERLPMKASIIKIGNSQGIRIPKPIIKQCGFDHEVELEVHEGKLIIMPARRSRQDWDKVFQEMAQNSGDDLLPLPDSKWDADEWEWE